MEKDTVRFETGFEFKGFLFGWLGKKLYRLPSIVHGKDYGLRKIPKINITKNIKGYRVIRSFKSVRQVEAMTTKINASVRKAECKQC